MESNHLPAGYQPAARPESLAAVVPAGDLNSPVSLTKAADRHLSLPGTTYGADGDARNPNLSLTKRAFFLLKATGRIPRTYGAEYGSSTRLTGLEDQHLSDRPTPQRHTYPVVKQLTTQLAGTAGFEPVPLFKMVGMLGLEPRSPCSQSRWVSRYPTSRKYFNPKAKAPNPLGIGAFWKANYSNRLRSPGARLD